MDHHRGKYDFYNSLSQILDSQEHPLHNTYVDALKSIRWPCTHGRVNITGDSPWEVFTLKVILSMRSRSLGWAVPTLDEPCGDFMDTYEPYAFLGAGSYGVAFAARARDVARDGTRLHVAAKFIPIQVAKSQAGGVVHHPEFGLVWNEALALALLRDHPGVPALYAVYAHGSTLIAVMELFGAWPDKDDLNRIKYIDFSRIKKKRHFNSLETLDGHDLLSPRRYIREHRKPEELDVCKMSCIHLSTLQLMKDRGCSHEDIAPRNMLIDGNYNVKFIDWGGAQFYPSTEKWHDNRFLGRREHGFIPPEWVSSGRRLLNKRKGRVIDDHRRIDLWRFSCVIYEYLHSNGPFGPLRPWRMRKTRLRHGELKVRDDLSQDCIDALQAMLEQNPQSRGTTEDLATLPWFSGHYLDANHKFERPVYRPFCRRRYSHRQFKMFRPPRIHQGVNVICYGHPIISDNDTLYRCFAEWEYHDQNRWQDIKMRALEYYTAFMQGKLYSGDFDADRAKREVYQRIDSEIPQGVAHHFQTPNDRCPTRGIIRIVADAFHCQAIILAMEEGAFDYRIRIHGNIHDEEPPEYYQIYLHYHYASDLFELVMLGSPGDPWHYGDHLRHDVILDNYDLDEDHEAILIGKRAAYVTKGQRPGPMDSPMFSLSNYHRYRSPPQQPQQL